MASMILLVLTYFAILGIFIPIISVQTIYAQSGANIAPSRDNIYGMNVSKTDLLLNPTFTLFNNVSKFPSYWNDSMNNCKDVFSCKVNFKDGFNDKESLEFSTKNSSKLWSWIRGQQINVKPNQQYELVTHMKLNEWATQSHALLEGFNETSKSWYQIKQCPPGVNGPLGWSGYICEIIIPHNTTKIRPVLNAGWSSQTNKDAVTWFDGVHLLALKQ